MVATVGSIAVDLSANTAKFTSDFNRAATTVDRQSKRMAGAVAGIGKSMASFGAGLAGGAAFAGLTSLTGMLNRAREAVSRLDDIADRAKTTGLGTELLQSLEHGAKNAGIEVNELSGGLTTFATNMGKAEEGTGRLFSGLLKLNPELLKTLLSTEDQEERLRLVADALNSTGDATERAALAAVAFGNADLGRVFGEGAAGIDALVQEAKDLDLIFTPEQIRRAGEYDEKLNNLADSINKNLDESLIQLVPLIADVTEAFLKATQEVGKYVEGVDELGRVTNDFFNNPNLQNFMEMMFGAGAGKAFMSPEALRAMQAQGGGGAIDRILGGMVPKPATGGGGTNVIRGGGSGAPWVERVPVAGGGTVGVTRFGAQGGGENKGLEKLEEATEEGTDVAEEGNFITKGGFEDSTRATEKVAERISDLDDNFGGYFRDFTMRPDPLRAGFQDLRGLSIDQLNELRNANNYLSGINDSLVGRQFTQQIKTPTDIIAGFAEGGPGFDEQFLGRFAGATNNTKNINIAYTPDPGETYATSQQRMRIMLETAQLAAARA